MNENVVCLPWGMSAQLDEAEEMFARCTIVTGSCRRVAYRR